MAMETEIKKQHVSDSMPDTVEYQMKCQMNARWMPEQMS